MNVWVIVFCEEPDRRVAVSAQKAYEICKEHIEQEIGLASLREQCLKELAEEYAQDPEWFGCSDVCAAEMVEVEGA